MKHCVWIFLALTISSYGQTPGNGVTDIDGNTYNSVIIGTQEWQKENLNVSKYTDGTIIPQVTDPIAWANLTTGAWCFYNNDPANGAIYGKLYNWYAVMGIHDVASNTNISQRKKLAPDGFHIPSDYEWGTLCQSLDPNATRSFATQTQSSIAGGYLKETGTTHWLSPNTGASNGSSFTGLPGGYRDIPIGRFYNIGEAARFWSSSTYPGGNPDRILYSIYYYNAEITRSSNLSSVGHSVRCIKDEPLSNVKYKSNSFNIYPNPAKEQITIDFGTNSNTIGWSYKIVNTLGQEVQNGDLNSQQNIIEMNNIKGHGIYFVKIYDSSNNLLDTKKIIIQQ